MRKSISKSKYIFKSLLQNRVLCCCCHTYVSILQRQKNLLIKKNGYVLVILSPCSPKPEDFFQVLRRRENDAFNAKNRSYTSSSQMCIFFLLFYHLTLTICFSSQAEWVLVRDCSSVWPEDFFKRRVICSCLMLYMWKSIACVICKGYYYVLHTSSSPKYMASLLSSRVDKIWFEINSQENAYTFLSEITRFKIWIFIYMVPVLHPGLECN